MLSWAVATAINHGGQVEAGERRKGGAEDGRAAVIMGSASSSLLWPEVRWGWKATQARAPPKM